MGAARYASADSPGAISDLGRGVRRRCSQQPQSGRTGSSAITGRPGRVIESCARSSEVRVVVEARRSRAARFAARRPRAPARAARRAAGSAWPRTHATPATRDDGRVHPAQVDRLAEREVVGVEEAATPPDAAAGWTGARARARATFGDGLSSGRRRPPGRGRAARDGPVELEVDAGHPVQVEAVAQPGLERVVDGRAARRSTVTKAVYQLPVQRIVAAARWTPGSALATAA